MIKSKSRLSTHQTIVLVVAGAAFPGWALATSTNLGEQALIAQSGATKTHTPEQAQFNSNFLSGQAKQIDLEAFSNGNPMAAGSYRVDIYVNGSWQGRRDLQFKADAQGHVDACLPLPMLEELGVDSETVLQQQTPSIPTDKNSCVPVQQRMADAYGIFDNGNLRYDLSVPQVFLRREVRGYVNSALWDRGINAGFIGYSFNASGNDSRINGGQRSRNAYLGLNTGLNLGGWQLRHDSNLTWSKSDGHHWQSIATYVQRGIPEIRGTLTLGEAYTSGELFDSVSYRGASLTSDDRMLPDSLRGYAPVVRGIAETTARVEVRQNEQLIYSTTVSPGSFVIDDLYPTGYGGDLAVSIIEADGRRREFKVPFGSVPQMLREGISRYSVTAGQVHNDLLSDEPWLLQGTYQRGIGNQLTLYGGSTASKGYTSQLYGVGLSTPIGAFSADVTHARTSFEHYGDYTGSSMRLSYSKMIGETGTNLTLAAYRYSTEGFYSLQDALYGRDLDQHGINPITRGRQRSQLQLTLNQPLGRRRGSLYMTGSVRNFYDRPGTSKQYQIGYNKAWGAMNFGFSMLRTEELGRSETQYLLSMTMPLGGGHPISFSVDLGARERGGYDNSRVGITGSAGTDNNFSYGLALSDSREGNTTAVGNAEYRSRYTALNATYSHSPDFRQASVGANGSLVVHPGGITFSPQRGDTMVLVEAPGAHDAIVSNASGLRIDDHGYALVPYASPYRLNTITLDPQGMAHDVELESTSQSITPFAGAISYLHFDTRKGNALLIEVRNTDHRVIPFGAQVKDEQGQPVGMVSQGGRVYVRSEHNQGHLFVKWGTDADQRCIFNYQIPPGADASKAGFIALEATCR
ncbi:TPA: fimbrial biogenesis outer membrane usher protein [Pseudomonas aeruginosa]|nr:fimbrial biogenesis outer membrane usher protein [Pseudomonas aeruginosa]